MAALQRFQAICTGGVAIEFSNFIPCLATFEKALAVQLADRRSKVVKETSETLSILARAVKDTRLSVDIHHRFVVVMSSFIEHLWQTLPQSVKVISEAGTRGIQEILENVVDDEGMSLSLFLSISLSLCLSAAILFPSYAPPPPPLPILLQPLISHTPPTTINQNTP